MLKTKSFQILIKIGPKSDQTRTKVIPKSFQSHSKALTHLSKVKVQRRALDFYHPLPSFTIKDPCRMI